MKRGTKNLVSLSLGCLALAGGLYAVVAWSQGESESGQVFSRRREEGPLVIAHRGGAGLWPENTLHAFENARALVVDVIETDVRSTSDGVLVVIHDATVERTTDGNGRVSEMTLAELKKLDAGFRWSPDGGKTFPLRGRGITIPTLEEVFNALPQMQFNIEPKQETPSIIEPLCRLLRKHEMTKKVVVGAFNSAVLNQFRRACPEVITSASADEVGKFLALQTGVPFAPAVRALQVPEFVGGRRLLTQKFVEDAHSRNLKVHAWTVNETEDMRRLLEMKVDGIITDYPDRLMSLLERQR